MGTKFKEVNTLSFIGNIGPKTERVWKEVHEEADIIGCKDKFNRALAADRAAEIIREGSPWQQRHPRTVISATWRRFESSSTRETLCVGRRSRARETRRPADFVRRFSKRAFLKRCA